MNVETNHITKSASHAARKTLLLASVLAVAGLLTACQGSRPAANKVKPTGIYPLVAVDGLQLPAEVDHGGTPIRVQSGQMTFGPDNTCVSVVTFQVSPREDFTREVRATYTIDGSELRMQWQGVGVTTATFTEDGFEMNNEGMVFEYAR